MHKATKREPITLAEMRAQGVCVFGIRRWLTSRGLSLKDVAQNGLDVDFVLESEDKQAIDFLERILEARRGR